MFKKFSSFDNITDKKEVENFLSRFPELNDPEREFIVWEKIDGSNFQLIFELDKPDYTLGSRNGTKSDSEDHFGVRKVLDEKYPSLISSVRKMLNQEIQTINLYGEIFGKSVLNRIDYQGPDIRFYYLRLNGIPVPPVDFLEFMSNIGFSFLSSPYEIIKGFNNAKAVDVETESALLAPDAKRRIKEGVVIADYREIFTSPIGNHFIFKKKSVNFREKEKRKIPKETNKNEMTLKLNEVFKTYINENRVLAMFSKQGKKIESHKEIGHWVKLIIEDAKKEFDKDYQEELDSVLKNEIRSVYNIGSKLANILIKQLEP